MKDNDQINVGLTIVFTNMLDEIPTKWTYHKRCDE